MFRQLFIASLIVGFLLAGGSSPCGAAPVSPQVSRKLYRARLEAAQQTFKVALADLRVAKVDCEKVYLWSKRWLEAEQALSTTKAERVTACQAHLKRMEDLRKVVMALYKVGKVAQSEVVGLEFYVAEGRVWEAEAMGK
jgi:outer membrane protein TolC